MLGRLSTVRRLAVGATALVAALALTGCVQMRVGPTATQPDEIGKVRLSFQACLTNAVTGNTDNCSGATNSNSAFFSNATPNPTGVGQMLAAYLLPGAMAATAPDTFTSDEVNVVFTRSTSYTSELTRVSPPPTGMAWVGYISQQIDIGGVSARSYTASPSFDLPAGPAAFVGPLSYVAGVGVRTNDAAAGRPATRPVACGTEILSLGDSGSTVCFDSPVIAVGQTLPPLQTAPVRDLAVVAPATVNAQRNTSVPVSFALDFAGAAMTQPIILSATTDITGAVVGLDSATFQPTADQNGTAVATLFVPLATRGGSYTVTLTAKRGDTTRQATAQIAVPVDRGQVSRAYVARTKTATGSQKIKRRALQAFAHFEFARLPETGTVIKTRWISPSGSVVVTRTQARRSHIVAKVRPASKMRKGTWRCRLLVNDQIVKTATVRVR